MKGTQRTAAPRKLAVTRRDKVGTHGAAGEPPIFSLLLPIAHNAQSGRYDARGIAELLDVSVADVARIIQEHPDSVRRRPDARRYQGGFRDLARLLVWLRRALKNDSSIRMWLNASSEELGGKSPLDLMLIGRLNVVMDHVYAAISGQGA